MPLRLLATTLLILGLLIQPLAGGCRAGLSHLSGRHGMDPRRHVPHGVG